MHKRENAEWSSQPKTDFGGNGGGSLPVAVAASQNLVKNSTMGLLSHPSVDFNSLPLQQSPSLLLLTVPQSLEMDVGCYNGFEIGPFGLQ